jgi:ubiquinone/menaquinone biosynthesis C-methylase UbiE
MKQARNEGKRIATEAAMKPDPICAHMPPASARSTALSGQAKHRDAEQRLWSTFWQDFALENQLQERCYVPGDGRHVVDQHWVQFADSLPKGAQVIDLGCGAGVVGRTLLGRRNDLHVTGVDWADVPMMTMPNLRVYAKVSMEALPFIDSSFDAAVSLFGIEYGHIAMTAQQLKRVLKSGARFSFLVHHRESEIFREGSTRRRALKALISGKMKAAFLTGNVNDLHRQRQSLKTHFPDEPMVNLVSNHFLRNIAQARSERQALWQSLADGLDPEIALLMHMERAAKSTVDIAAWLVALLATMALVSVSVLRRSAGEPIAWSVSGVR